MVGYLAYGPILVVLTGPAAAGSAHARYRRPREHGDLAPTT